MENKTCSRCRKIKLIDEYSKGYTFCKQCKREDYHNNPQRKIRQNQVRKRRYDNDPVYREIVILRRHLNDAWRNYNYWKNNRAMKALCVPNKEYFIEYIKTKFDEYMTLDNYGGKKGNWQFDHIIPLNEAKTIEDVHRLFHYTNIQPLWRKDNMTKRSKLNWSKV